jgi:hypothetical protein
METVRFLKHRFRLGLHGTKSKKSSLIDQPERFPEDSVLPILIVSLYGEDK